MDACADAPRRLAKDGHILRVPPKGTDVGLHPLERLDLCVPTPTKHITRTHPKHSTHTLSPCSPSFFPPSPPCLLECRTWSHIPLLACPPSILRNPHSPSRYCTLTTITSPKTHSPCPRVDGSYASGWFDPTYPRPVIQSEGLFKSRVQEGDRHTWKLPPWNHTITGRSAGLAPTPLPASESITRSGNGTLPCSSYIVGILPSRLSCPTCRKSPLPVSKQGHVLRGPHPSPSSRVGSGSGSSTSR